MPWTLNDLSKDLIQYTLMQYLPAAEFHKLYRSSRGMQSDLEPYKEEKSKHLMLVKIRMIRNMEICHWPIDPPGKYIPIDQPLIEAGMTPAMIDNRQQYLFNTLKGDGKLQLIYSYLHLFRSPKTWDTLSSDPVAQAKMRADMLKLSKSLLKEIDSFGDLRQLSTTIRVILKTIVQNLNALRERLNSNKPLKASQKPIEAPTAPEETDQGRVMWPAPVLDSPSTGQQIGLLPKGTLVKMISPPYGWVRVEYDAGEGWIHRGLIGPVNVSA